MTRKQALIELRDKVKAGGDTLGEVLDIERELNVKPLGGHVTTFWKAAHGSLDAAKALHDAVLPGWTVRMTAQIPSGLAFPYVHIFKMRMTECDPPQGANSAGYEGYCPARAWLLAILEALIAQEPDT
jgi:hypothetical protein